MRPINWEDFMMDCGPNGPDLTGLAASGLRFSVRKEPVITLSGTPIPRSFALVRDSDKKVLTMCGEQYVPRQNLDVLNEFTEFCNENMLTVDKVGAFSDGKWFVAVARLGLPVSLGDELLQSYVVISHPHVYGQSTAYYYLCCRESTKTTFVANLSGNVMSEAIMANEFYLDTFRKMKERPIEDDQIRKYFMQVFYPKVKEYESLKVYAQRAYDLIHLVENPSWFDAFQVVLYSIDFCMGRDRVYAVFSGWFGDRAVLKRKALKLFY